MPNIFARGVSSLKRRLRPDAAVQEVSPRTPDVAPAPAGAIGTFAPETPNFTYGTQVDLGANAQQPHEVEGRPVLRTVMDRKLADLGKAMEILEAGDPLPNSLNEATNRLLQSAQQFVSAHGSHRGAEVNSDRGVPISPPGNDLPTLSGPAELANTSVRPRPPQHGHRLADRIAAAVPLNSGTPVELEASPADDSLWPAPLRIAKSPDRDIGMTKPLGVSQRQELINGRAREANANGL